ncbi:hypothetical protein H2203_009240 [Taxawa tesnikishii (nom. ined.)]|nr:hypothetical protein H2203_009240 [Dothideales sp. JES 119]
MSNPWEDRRGLFQRGKEVHEPGSPVTGRRGSGGSISDELSKTMSNQTTSSNSGAADSNASPTSQRRRSSNTALFGNLTQHKRGSQDYGERRSSIGEQGAKSGMFGTWYNQTFRGVQKPENQTGSAESKRGVME